MADAAQPVRRPERPLRRATIKDVADAAGVSRSTASRALNGRGYVGLGIRERVQAAAETLGYVPDDMARHLKERVSRSVGVLVSDLRTPFYADVAAGISTGARRRGLAMVLGDGSGSAVDEVETARRFVALRVAGVILTPVSAQVTTFLARQRVPVVEVDRHFGGGSCDVVVVAGAAAAGEAAEHLLGLGHRRIALLVDLAGWSADQDREAGFRQACATAGVPVDDSLVVRCGPGVAAARDRALELLRGPGAPTAVLTTAAWLAEGVWRAATDLRLRIPDELSLVTFDDAPWMSLVTPAVTAVEQDGVRLGEIALERLLGRIEAPAEPPQTVALTARTHHRGSTAAPPGARAVAGGRRSVNAVSHMGAHAGQTGV
ncbi:LacI family DNA-binding transcriptional regulator [uncultured Cellulomonas sp.]|uniref:LacI family DNA-binding transcriptional regulator n=1 Tax=uncultured Cellulomonas sp. TaxID=189682 RepID=UPI002603A79D|nr:LacI family DNA-binding transcriptional regulator [uncultured Cellulomonas sp.]